MPSGLGVGCPDFYCNYEEEKNNHSDISLGRIVKIEKLGLYKLNSYKNSRKIPIKLNNLRLIRTRNALKNIQYKTFMVQKKCELYKRAVSRNLIKAYTSKSLQRIEYASIIKDVKYKAKYLIKNISNLCSNQKFNNETNQSNSVSLKRNFIVKKTSVNDEKAYKSLKRIIPLKLIPCSKSLVDSKRIIPNLKKLNIVINGKLKF